MQTDETIDRQPVSKKRTENLMEILPQMVEELDSFEFGTLVVTKVGNRVVKIRTEKEQLIR